MKDTDFSGFRGLIIPGIAIVLLAGWCGHSLGTSEARRRMDRLAQDPPLAHPPGIGEKSPAGRQLDAGNMAAGSAANRLKRLNSIWRNSPDPAYDYELLAETGRLVAKMSSEEIAAAIQSVPPGLERQASYSRMRLALISAWVLKDGPAALAFLGSHDLGDPTMVRMASNSAIIDWVGDQPDACLTWLKEGKLTPSQQKAARSTFSSVMTALIQTHPARAFQELSSLGPKEVADQLQSWSLHFGGDAAMRETLLEHAAATGRPEDLLRVQSGMLTPWASKDPAAALKYVDSLQLADLERQNLEALIVQGQIKGNPQEALDGWLQRNAAANVVPAALTQTVTEWMSNQQDDAIHWLETIPASAQRDAIYQESIRSLAGFDRYPKAAGLANGIESPQIRAKAFQSLNQQWNLAKPEDAMAWRAGLSVEDQSLISGN